MEHSEITIREEKYVITSANKKWAFGLMIIGALLALIGYLTYHPHVEGLGEHDLHHLVTKRLLGNILIDGYFFFLIATCAIIFVTISQLANAGWYVAIRRIPEAMSRFMPFGALVIILVSVFGIGYLYHWAHEGIMDPNAPNFDKVLAGKSWYLNKPFFLIRLIGFTTIWILFARTIRKNSINEDSVGGLLNFNKNIKTSAAYLVIFGFSFAMFTWDMMMSIDPHWYSTIFWIYNFATGWVSAISIIYLFTWYLRGKGYLNVANDDHNHDLGKFMFAFSVFWTYMWVAQFLLIWYANIPEEVEYYKNRMFGTYVGNFYVNIFLNFIVPFFVFMRRGAKRNPISGVIVGSLILIGHWNDVYLMVMPGVMNLAVTPNAEYPLGIMEIPSQGIGLMEIGFLALFAGGFLFVVFKALAAANLYPTRHPYIYESAMHDTGV
jgi:hypothetical protein